jgi:hypothetical protein
LDSKEKEDGTISAAMLEKKSAEIKAEQESAARASAFKNGYHELARIDEETEKAVGIKVTFDLCDVEKDAARTLWFPKSMMKDGKFPGWMICKKFYEAGDELRARNLGSVLDPEFSEIVKQA